MSWVEIWFRCCLFEFVEKSPHTLQVKMHLFAHSMIWVSDLFLDLDALDDSLSAHSVTGGSDIFLHVDALGDIGSFFTFLSRLFRCSVKSLTPM